MEAKEEEKTESDKEGEKHGGEVYKLLASVAATLLQLDFDGRKPLLDPFSQLFAKFNERHTERRGVYLSNDWSPTKYIALIYNA